MSIEYDLFANPPRNGEEKPTLHARAINIQTVNTNELARMIESMSTFTTADIKGAIKAISDRLYFCLSNSQSVHLEGIGTFSVTLRCKQQVENKKDIRSASIEFKNVEFRADPELKKRFRGVRIERREKKLQCRYPAETYPVVYKKLWDNQPDGCCQPEPMHAAKD